MCVTGYLLLGDGEVSTHCPEPLTQADRRAGDPLAKTLRTGLGVHMGC